MDSHGNFRFERGDLHTQAPIPRQPAVCCQTRRSREVPGRVAIGLEVGGRAAVHLVRRLAHEGRVPRARAHGRRGCNPRVERRMEWRASRENHLAKLSAQRTWLLLQMTLLRTESSGRSAHVAVRTVPCVVSPVSRGRRGFMDGFPRCLLRGLFGSDPAALLHLRAEGRRSMSSPAYTIVLSTERRP